MPMRLDVSSAPQPLQSLSNQEAQMGKDEALAKARTLTLYEFEEFSLTGTASSELEEAPDGGYWIPARVYVSKETLERAVVED